MWNNQAEEEESATYVLQFQGERQQTAPFFYFPSWLQWQPQPETLCPCDVAVTSSPWQSAFLSAGMIIQDLLEFPCSVRKLQSKVLLVTISARRNLPVSSVTFAEEKRTNSKNTLAENSWHNWSLLFWFQLLFSLRPDITTLVGWA